MRHTEFKRYRVKLTRRGYFINRNTLFWRRLSIRQQRIFNLCGRAGYPVILDDDNRIDMRSHAIKLCKTKRGNFMRKVYSKKKIWHASKSQGTREKIFRRAKGICLACNEPLNAATYEVDHKLPISKGGSDEISNLWAIHRRCHALKTALVDKNFTRADLRIALNIFDVIKK